MPRYFFDIQDGVTVRDEEDVDLADLKAVSQEVRKVLPSIAAHEVYNDGERQTFSVVVTDEYGRAVYSEVLTYTGMSLIR